MNKHREPPNSEAHQNPKHSNRSTSKSNADLSTPKAATHRHIRWADNPQWTDCLVAYLLENPRTRLKLTGNSTQNAKAEGRSKVTHCLLILYLLELISLTQVSNGEKKKDYWAAIAKAIWDHEDEPEHAAYLAQLEHYNTSIQGQISW